jgi:hypothetical protein
MEDQEATAVSAPEEPSATGNVETLVYGNYRSIISGENPTWAYGGFPLPDGSFWRYREPNAAVIVEGERMRVTVMPVTRHHDEVQILDNAKNMFFSTRMFDVPERGSITLEWDQGAECYGTAPGDLYDGFVSVNLLDFATGMALDWFMSNDVIATVYARLPFPGVPMPADQTEERPKFFCAFHELDVPHRPRQMHRCGISYAQDRDEVVFTLDGTVVDRYAPVPAKMSSFLIALGNMTEKGIENGQSVSCHGQGITGFWGPFTITWRRD